ncbi:glycosyltransferase [Microgenomates group bacterium]|nr:glycosyltransferase [Microgenomates group bacterium]
MSGIILRKTIKAAGQKILAVHKKIEGEIPDFSGWKDKKVVVVWSTISYNFRHQRPQEWADRLAADGYLVIYIENEFLTVEREKKLPPFRIEAKKKNLWLLTLGSDWNYFIYTQTPTDLSSRVIKKSWEHFLTATNLKLDSNEVTHLVQQPFWMNFTWLGENERSTLIGECFDWHKGFALKAKKLDQLEERMALKANKVVVSAHFLRAWMREKGVEPNKIFTITNGVNYENFASLNFKKNEGKIIGYCGAIEEWMDGKIIASLAQKYPHQEIRLIGKNNNPLISKLAKRYANIKLRGEISFMRVPEEINKFDVCLIPFEMNKLTEATSPVKFFEYLALGKPVVSTNLRELQTYQKVCYLAKSRDDFISQVDKALNEEKYDKIDQLQNMRKAIAKENSWTNKFTQLKKIIEQ